jgi:hypothetical protein
MSDGQKEVEAMTREEIQAELHLAPGTAFTRELVFRRHALWKRWVDEARNCSDE